MILCSSCHHSNPAENRFCGMCGARLERRRTPDSELLPEDSERGGPSSGLPRAAAPAWNHDTPLSDAPASAASVSDPGGADQPAGYSVSGPSFLGLGDPQNTDPQYLLEEDDTRHGTGKWILTIVVLLAILAYGQWRANGRGKTLFTGLPTLRAPEPPPPAAKQPAPAAADNSDLDIDVQPTNADLKAQTDAAKKAQKETAAPQNPADDWKQLPKPSTEVGGQATSAGADPAPATIPPRAALEPKPAPRLEKAKAAANARPAPAQADHSASLLAEGQRYLYGQGVHKSCDRALNLIHDAANQGSAEARSQLGGMYATGNCAPFDRVTAYRWFTLALAASPRNSTAQRTRDMLWREMTETERQRARNLNE
ncbi:MAG: hypothetical protein JO041_04860 [Acidobacteria bacterium]|nr:hypothetical protein [Acidobacteriota bacterium]